MRCECCATSRHVRPYKTGGRFLAHLCRSCAAAGHALEDCLLCGGRVWRCQRLVHMDQQHRSMLEQIMNRPQSEFEPPPPQQRYLGRLQLGPRGEGLGE